MSFKYPIQLSKLLVYEDALKSSFKAVTVKKNYRALKRSVNSPCKPPAFVNIIDIQPLSLSLPILLVEILICDVFSCACKCAVHLPF